MKLKRTISALLAAHLALVPASVFASQNQLSSPTTGTVSGLQLTNNYNNALDSVNTGNSGGSAPVNQLSGVPSLGNVWIDTTGNPYPWQVYDGADWLTPFWIDAVNHVTNVKIGGGAATAASASTVDLCGSAVAPAAYTTITGTTTISSFGSTCKAGHVKFITFSGVLQLTYNATSLIIPGAQNVITAAGDQAVLLALGSGNWQVAFYQPASGAALVNPAIDLGTYQFTSAVVPPSAKYLFAYGQAISRTTYAGLMAVQTITQSVTRTNGSPTLTGFSDTTQIAAGACVEGPGVPNSGSCTTSIVSCTSTTCTMTNNASSSGTANVTIFPNGNGDGATTFNLPDCQGRAIAGRDNMSGTPAGRISSAGGNFNADALGTSGGQQNQAIALANVPNYALSPSGIANNTHIRTLYQWTSGTSPGGNYSQMNVAVEPPNSTGSVTDINVLSGTIPSGGSGTALAIVQPTLIGNCMIRVLAKLEPPVPASLAANDDLTEALAVVERRRLAA